MLDRKKDVYEAEACYNAVRQYDELEDLDKQSYITVDKLQLNSNSEKSLKYSDTANYVRDQSFLRTPSPKPNQSHAYQDPVDGNIASFDVDTGTKSNYQPDFESNSKHASDENNNDMKPTVGSSSLRYS